MVGYKTLEKSYSPNPYSHKKGAPHVGPHQLAEEAALYLEVPNGPPPGRVCRRISAISTGSESTRQG
eukprot:9146506-Prorocentrum_lima.AAC.1